MLAFNHTTDQFENVLSDKPEINLTLSQILGFEDCVFPKELIISEKKHFSSTNGHNFPKDCKVFRQSERTSIVTSSGGLVKTRKFG